MKPWRAADLTRADERKTEILSTGGRQKPIMKCDIRIYLSTTITTSWLVMKREMSILQCDEWSMHVSWKVKEGPTVIEVEGEKSKHHRKGTNLVHPNKWQIWKALVKTQFSRDDKVTGTLMLLHTNLVRYAYHWRMKKRNWMGRWLKRHITNEIKRRRVT